MWKMNISCVSHAIRLLLGICNCANRSSLILCVVHLILFPCDDNTKSRSVCTRHSLTHKHFACGRWAVWLSEGQSVRKAEKGGKKKHQNKSKVTKGESINIWCTHVTDAHNSQKPFSFTENVTHQHNANIVFFFILGWMRN